MKSTSIVYIQFSETLVQNPPFEQGTEELYNYYAVSTGFVKSIISLSKCLSNKIVSPIACELDPLL